MPPATLQKWITWGLVIIIALMPFHAFLSVYLGSLVGHQAIIQSWKDVLVALMSLAGAYLVVTSPDLRQRLWRPVNIAIFAFIALGLAVSLAHYGNSLRGLGFGIKTDCEFLVLFVLAQLADHHQLENRILRLVIITSAVVGLFGVVQALFLPRDFLAQFGYGASTIRPYELIDPAIPNSVRIISTLSGPNQLGEFLILPICLLTAMIIKKRKRLIPAIILAVCLFTLFSTYSRSAWAGAATALGVTTLLSLPKKVALWLSALGLVALVAVGLVGSSAIAHHSNLQYYLLHGRINVNHVEGSDQGRIASLKNGLSQAISHPLGKGLGTAGPASYHSTQAIITENYYLQLGIEVGIVGLVLFLVIIGLAGIELAAARQTSQLSVALLGALAGLTVINLFLHGWADSSTALSFWAIAGVAISQTARPQAAHG